MIFGEYPCCDGALALAVPEQTPAYFSEKCPHCGAVVWHRLSRLEPRSWTEEAFLAEHEVVEEGRRIVPKPGTEAAAFEKLNSDPDLIRAFEMLAEIGAGGKPS